MGGGRGRVAAGGHCRGRRAPVGGPTGVSQIRTLTNPVQHATAKSVLSHTTDLALKTNQPHKENPMSLTDEEYRQLVEQKLQARADRNARERQAEQEAQEQEARDVLAA